MSGEGDEESAHQVGYLHGSAFWEAGSPPSLGISSDIPENDAGEPPVPRNGKPEATWAVSVGSRFSLLVDLPDVGSDLQ